MATNYKQMEPREITSKWLSNIFTKTKTKVIQFFSTRPLIVGHCAGTAVVTL